MPPSYDTHSDCDCIQCVADCNIGGESPEPGCEILILYRCNVGGVVVGGGGSDMWGTDAVYHIQSHISWVTANTNIFQFQIVFSCSLKYF